VGLLAHQLDGRLTGVGRYMVSLTAELCSRDNGIEVLPLVVGPLGALDDDPHVRRRIPTDPQVRHALALTYRASRVVGHRASFVTIGNALSSIAARRLRLDVIHDLTGIAPFFLSTGSCRRLITVHDLISYLPGGGNDLVDDALQRLWLPATARAAHGIVTVSATTGADVQRYLHVTSARVHIARHGVDARFRPLSKDDLEKALRRYGLSPGYIFFIGSGSPRKNLDKLVGACRLMWSRGGRTRLVVAGPARSAAITLAGDDIAAGRVVCTGYVPEQDLPALYNGAAVVAFPSSYEGFGLPALEAMSCGTPVLAGLAGALPEVVGDAGVLVDPADVAGMARELADLLDDGNRRSRLRELGLQRARSFTWSRTADETSDVYRRLMQVRAGERVQEMRSATP